MIQQRTHSRHENSGQALFEFVLVVILVVGIFTIVQFATLKGIGKLWGGLAREIAAACPKCEPPDELRTGN